MWYRLFFAINGPDAQYTNYPPLPLPSAVALVIGFVGLIVVIRYRRQLFRSNPYAVLILLASALYIIALMAQGYSTYQFTAVLENMNGRYLLPVLLLLGGLIAKAFSLALKKSDHLKVILACVVVVLFLEGGGILTFIARSDSSWYWQNSKVIKANNVAQKITNKLVVKGKKTYDTSFWFFN
jgi:cation transport ATPase